MTLSRVSGALASSASRARRLAITRRGSCGCGSREPRRGKAFDDLGVGGQAPAVALIGVAAGEQDAQTRTQRAQLLPGLGPALLGHDQVEQREAVSGRDVAAVVGLIRGMGGDDLAL